MEVEIQSYYAMEHYDSHLNFHHHQINHTCITSSKTKVVCVNVYGGRCLKRVNKVSIHNPQKQSPEHPLLQLRSHDPEEQDENSQLVHD